LPVNSAVQIIYRIVSYSRQKSTNISLTLSKDADRHSLVMRGMIVFFSDVYSTSPANVGIIPRHNSCTNKVSKTK